MAVGVENGGSHSHHIDAGSEHLVAPDDLLRRGRGGQDRQRGQTEDRDEPRGTHTSIVNPSRFKRGIRARGDLSET
jgi:hypothetical protein